MFDSAEDKTRESNEFELPRPASIVAGADRAKRDVSKLPEQRNVQGRKEPWPGREKPRNR